MKSIFKTKNIFKGIIKRGIFFDFPLSRGLPKTGQVTSYDNFDDGHYEAGWWRGRLNANNKTRFIAKTIKGDDVDDDIVIDRATGLMWPADGNRPGCNYGIYGDKLNFAETIAYAKNLSFAGYSDWRIPNVFELFSICDMSKNSPMIDESFFPNCQSGVEYWTSTTDAGYPTYAIYVNFEEIDVDSAPKTSLLYLRCVRGGL